MARILLGVSGGIAAYKALEFIRLATGAGHAVRVIQTPSSQRFVGAASFAALTGAPVLTQEWERDPMRGAFPGQSPPEHDPLSHLELVRNADVFLVAPATANTLARLAGGLADNLLGSAALAATCPLVLAPAMNDKMWAHPATQANVRLLSERGARIVAPGVGRLASAGEAGAGRLAEPQELLDAVEALVGRGPRPWDGLRVLISAGGTREPIDSVRFVGNRSSGRMGFALAAAAAARGAEVAVVAANVALLTPAGVTRHDVETAAELQVALEQAFEACDVLIMSAAVADFRPVDPPEDKLKKAGREGLTIHMESTVDVLSLLSAQRRDGQTLVGFAAEHGHDAVRNGAAKRERKGLDAVVVNDISRADIGFDSTDNEVTILTAAGEQGVARAGKDAIAVAILDTVDVLRALHVTSVAP